MNWKVLLLARLLATAMTCSLPWGTYLSAATEAPSQLEVMMKKNLPNGIKGAFDTDPIPGSDLWNKMVAPVINQRGKKTDSDSKFLKNFITNEAFKNYGLSYGIAFRIRQLIEQSAAYFSDAENQMFQSFIKTFIVPSMQDLSNKAPKSNLIKRITDIQNAYPDNISQQIQEIGKFGVYWHLTGEQFTDEERQFVKNFLDSTKQKINPVNWQQYNQLASFATWVRWTELQLPDKSKALFDVTKLNELNQFIAGLQAAAKNAYSTGPADDAFIKAVQDAFNTTTGGIGAQLQSLQKALRQAPGSASTQATALALVDFIKNTVYPLCAGNYWALSNCAETIGIMGNQNMLAESAARVAALDLRDNIIRPAMKQLSQAAYQKSTFRDNVLAENAFDGKATFRWQKLQIIQKEVQKVTDSGAGFAFTEDDRSKFRTLLQSLLGYNVDPTQPEKLTAINLNHFQEAHFTRWIVGPVRWNGINNQESALFAKMLPVLDAANNANNEAIKSKATQLKALLDGNDVEKMKTDLPAMVNHPFTGSLWNSLSGCIMKVIKNDLDAVSANQNNTADGIAALIERLMKTSAWMDSVESSPAMTELAPGAFDLVANQLSSALDGLKVQYKQLAGREYGAPAPAPTPAPAPAPVVAEPAPVVTTAPVVSTATSAAPVVTTQTTTETAAAAPVVVAAPAPAAAPGRGGRSTKGTDAVGRGASVSTSTQASAGSTSGSGAPAAASKGVQSAPASSPRAPRGASVSTSTQASTGSTSDSGAPAAGSKGVQSAPALSPRTTRGASVSTSTQASTGSTSDSGAPAAGSKGVQSAPASSPRAPRGASVSTSTQASTGSTSDSGAPAAGSKGVQSAPALSPRTTRGASVSTSTQASTGSTSDSGAPAAGSKGVQSAPALSPRTTRAR